MSARIVKHLAHSWSFLSPKQLILSKISTRRLRLGNLYAPLTISGRDKKAHDVSQPGMIGGLFHVELGTLNF